MNNSQQLEWLNLNHWINKIAEDSGQNVDHLYSTVIRMQTTWNFSAPQIAAICVLMRNAYGVGKGKAF